MGDDYQRGYSYDEVVTEHFVQRAENGSPFAIPITPYSREQLPGGKEHSLKG
jgi:hypothetical protein